MMMLIKQIIMRGSYAYTSIGVLLALAIAGYPAVGFMSAIIDIQGNVLSILFRITVVLMSVYVFLKYFDGRVLLGARSFLLVIFLFLYGLRLLADLVRGYYDGVGEVLVFYLAVVVAPTLALMFADSKNVELAVGPILLFLSGLITSAALIFEFSGIFGSHSLLETTGRLSVDTVNSITLGHTAATAVIVAFAVNWCRGIACFLYKAFVAISGIACIVLAGSKGALLALMFAFVFLMLAQRMKIGAVIASSVIVSILAAVVFALRSLGYSLWQRFYMIGEDESTRIRLRLFNDAFEQFMQYPLTGSAHVEINSGTYPHNLLLESLMSMGLLGGALFVALNISGVLRAWKLVQAGVTLLPLLYIQAFVGSMFSGSIYAHAALWATLAILLRPHSVTLSVISGKLRHGVQRKVVRNR